MNRIRHTLIITAGCFYFLQCSPTDVKEEVVTYESFSKVSLSDIEPEGWIREFLERQVSGLTGNIEVAGYPYNTCMWSCEKMEGSTKAWWPYEQTAYFLDGAYRLGLLLDESSLLNRVEMNASYVKSNILPDGRFGTRLEDRWWRWPYAGFNRIFMTEYEETHNTQTLDLLVNHYATFSAVDFQDDLELANVEELCWVYEHTGDMTFLRMAEEAYELFNSDLNNRNRLESDIQFGTDRIPDHHGVVYMELVKVPAILYQYTGKKHYLEDAVNGIRKMEKHHMLVSGLPSTTEHFGGISETAGHETCNTAVLPHSYGYLMRITGESGYGDRIEHAVFNAGMGSITKDFKSHQYFSAPNQVIATAVSNPFGHHPARMAFMPGHDVECCTGNVNRFMPYYVEQMWLTSEDNGIVAALYGPSSVVARVGEQAQSVKLRQETSYPFAEEISFTLDMDNPVEFPVYFRIPEWAVGAGLAINGNQTDERPKASSFHKVLRVFEPGDQLVLTLPMKPTISTWPNDGVAVEMGPLVFSLPVTPEIEQIENDGKSTNEFPAWSTTPGSKWNYSLVDDPQFEVIRNRATDYPWDPGNEPLKVKAQAVQLDEWKIDDSYDEHWKMDMLKTPAFPESRSSSSDQETIELVPYGSTTLRITVFPKTLD